LKLLNFSSDNGNNDEIIKTKWYSKELSFLKDFDENEKNSKNSNLVSFMRDKEQMLYYQQCNEMRKPTLNLRIFQRRGRYLGKQFWSLESGQ